MTTLFFASAFINIGAGIILLGQKRPRTATDGERAIMRARLR